MLLMVVALAAGACRASETVTLSASAPFKYPTPAEVSVERVAVVVTVSNRSDDDLLVGPADFAVRDREGRIYTSNVAATVADARVVRLAGGQRGMSGLLPLSLATLRKNDVLSGFVVFDVPADGRPVQLIFRQSDTDRVVDLPGSR